MSQKRNLSSKNTLLNFLQQKKTKFTDGTEITHEHEDSETEATQRFSDSPSCSSSHLPLPPSEETTACKTSTDILTCDSYMDISLFKNKSLCDTEKLRILNQVWVPDVNFKFPTDKCKNQNRKFCHSWLSKYKWLTYSKIEDAAYCRFCVLFAPTETGFTSSQVTGQLVKVGFRKWKNALERFEQHNNSIYHNTATVKANNYLDVMSGKMAPIDKTIDNTREIQARENREKLKPIIRTVILCGRQGIALRGHKDYGEFNMQTAPEHNEGNFRALLRARIEAGDNALKNHFETCSKNATYISWNIQNQIIDACDTIIKKKITSEINAAKCFTVLADETTDISTVEQLTLCVRYVIQKQNSDYKIHEHFLQFMPVESTTGMNLAMTILRGLKECGIDTSFLRGQGYDGAASMSGKFRGTQAYILEKHPTALYVHCVSHSLNLALSNSAEIAQIRNCFGTIEKIYAFFNTPKRQNVLQDKINNLEEVVHQTKLKKLCPTRWVERHDAVLIMVQLLLPVTEALDEIKSWNDKESSSGANILLQALIQSEFIISLLSSEKLLTYTLSLSKVLQTSDMDLAAAIEHAGKVISIITAIRNNAEEEFGQIFKVAEEKAAKLGTSISVRRLVKQQTMRSNVPAENPEEYYRRAIFIPWVDSYINNLSERFLKHKDILQNFTCLLPTGKIITQQQKEQFLKLAEFYHEDLNQFISTALSSECEIWYASFCNSPTPKIFPKNAIDAINMCNNMLYPNVFTLLKIFCTLPVSTSTAERSFSTLRRTKSYLRNTMSENRLNGLANLNIHREISIDPDEVISILQEKGARRLNFVL